MDSPHALSESVSDPAAVARRAGADRPHAGQPVRILVVGQTPPPHHGQAIVTRRILQAEYSLIELFHVRMAFSSVMEEVGRFRLAKVFHLFVVIFRIVLARIRFRPEVLMYPPAGPNRVPAYRDIIILIATRWMFRTTVFHFQAGGVSTLYPHLSPVVRWFFRRAYHGADAAIRLSPYNPEDGRDLLARQEYIVPNCANDERAQYLAGKVSETGDCSRQSFFQMLYLSTVCRTKGIEVLLEACALLKQRGVDFRLEVVGSFQPSGYRDTVESVIAEHQLQNHVTFAGQKTGWEKSRSYRNADVFCFPTYYESETFGLVAAEAMSASLPVVATLWRGLPSVVEDGKTGFLVPVRDAQALAEKLQFLADDPVARAAMGQAGRAKYEAEFTADRFRETMENALYQAATNRR